MAAARSSNSASPHTELERVLVDIVRLAARDDAPGITRRVRRWVSSPAARRGGMSPELRSEIMTALNAQPPAGRTRHAVRETQPSLLHVDRLPARDAQTPRPSLDASGRSAIEAIVAEYRRRDELERHGLAPTRTLLFAGPPGVGKTMAARWLAAQLGLPLLSIEPAQIMTSLLGESARNLVAALQQAAGEPCVVLLDEIDAFGKSRDDAHDIGELKRLVTTLLVELDRWPAGNLLIGATNHPALLDHALERRFERRVWLGPPAAEQRREIIDALLSEHGASSTAGARQALVALTSGHSGSQLRTLVQCAMRSAVLSGADIDETLLRDALPPDPSTLDKQVRAEFVQIATAMGHFSQRQLAELLGCSHTSVGRILRHEAA